MTSNEVKPISGQIVIDATDLILGRMASTVAKLVLKGERVIIINAEKALISGNKKNIVENVQKKIGLRTLGSQKKAPKQPRKPDGFVRLTVRKMLPWKKNRGKKAYRRLKVYVGEPEETKKQDVQTLPKAKRDVYKFITVGEVLRTFGWNS
jgi:large subunit ribosomal protein L13